MVRVSPSHPQLRAGWDGGLRSALFLPSPRGDQGFYFGLIFAVLIRFPLLVLLGPLHPLSSRAILEPVYAFAENSHYDLPLLDESLDDRQHTY